MSGNMLHQLLAVEHTLVTQAKAIMAETKDLWTKRAAHLDGIRKVYTPFKDEGEKIAPEINEVVTTVKEKLNYAKTAVIKAIDATLSKEETNASGEAKAALEVDGTLFGEFSAISLLALEKYLVNIRDEYKDIPTLDPAKTWVSETASGKGLKIAGPFEAFRSMKEKKVIQLAAATEKHPEQVQLDMVDVQVGKYETTYYSGRLTPGEKSTLLDKIDRLILAVKQAKQAANQAQVIQVNVGKALFDYIHG
jgi:hypothetical protein